MDGKWWWWCPEHKRPNNFDGLYVTHEPGKGHQKWLARRRCAKRDREPAGNDSNRNNPAPLSSSEPCFVLNDQMNQALITHHGFSELQMQAMQDVSGKSEQGN